MELLRIEGVSKRFGEFAAVSGMTLSIPAGRLTAVNGPNGAGKTTLINLATGALSHGDQRLLELGIAIAPAPQLCFLDEPSSGLTPTERSTVLELIRRLSAERRTTFVIVEHDMDVVFSLAEWIVVMNRGEVLAEGLPAEIRENRTVREVYLGEEFAA